MQNRSLERRPFRRISYGVQIRHTDKQEAVPDGKFGYYPQLMASLGIVNHLHQRQIPFKFIHNQRP